MDKVKCYRCESYGTVEGYLRTTCSHYCDDKYRLLKIRYNSLEKCHDCKYNLLRTSYLCPVCHGRGTIDWIDTMFRK